MSEEQSVFREVEFGGDQILQLNGRVVEYFKQDQPAVPGGWRWHVNHVAVEAKPRKDGGLKLRIGRERDGQVWAQATAEVPPGDVDAVAAFFEIAKRSR